MTKEELIELSDLNREDNIKYISSEAQGIAITLDSDRYAPTLCKLERAYICGRRKSEKRIADLEKENAELKTRVENQKSFLERIRAKFNLGEIEKKEIEGYLESENLTKAKEIIREIMNWYWETDICSDSMPPEIRQKAEQFLSEVEK